MEHHPMMKFYSPHYTIGRKLKLLIQLEDQLLKADKERKENRKGTQEICRMVSTSQSYYMFDSNHYRVARKILHDFDRRDQYADENEDYIYKLLKAEEERKKALNEVKQADE